VRSEDFGEFAPVFAMFCLPNSEPIFARQEFGMGGVYYKPLPDYDTFRDAIRTNHKTRSPFIVSFQGSPPADLDSLQPLKRALTLQPLRHALAFCRAILFMDENRVYVP
jgi:hypothetical protein